MHLHSGKVISNHLLPYLQNLEYKAKDEARVIIRHSLPSYATVLKLNLTWQNGNMVALYEVLRGITACMRIAHIIFFNYSSCGAGDKAKEV